VEKAQELSAVPGDDLLAGLAMGYWITGQRDEALKVYRDLTKQSADYEDEKSIREQRVV